MADLIHLNRNVANGLETYSALMQIRNGVGKLMEMEGVKNESIGKGAAVMQADFGTADNAEAQALADRWNDFLVKWRDTGDASYGELRDLVNAFRST